MSESAADRLRLLVSPDPLHPADQSSAACLARLRLALQLCDEGVEMMRENLRRRHPEFGSAELEARLLEWLHERPGAELGDGWGRPRRL